jgi:hypothetical protein
MAAAKSGQITITTHGTAQVGPSTMNNQQMLDILVKARPANTGSVYVGNDGAGDVDSANGFILAAGDVCVIHDYDLSGYWFDSAVDGEGFCWLIVPTKL